MNTILKGMQDDFIQLLADFDNWPDRFSYLIDLGNSLEVLCPDYLLPYRIKFCQSKTHFKAEVINGVISVSGWSNAGTMRGLIASIMYLFNGVPVDELSTTTIDFHEKTDLINNLTPLRKEALLEMIHRINVLSTSK